MNIFGHDIENTWIVDYESDDLSARYNPDVRVYLTGMMNVATGEYTLHEGFTTCSGTLVFHNAAFDVSLLRARGVHTDTMDIFCTMIASHTLRPASAEEHSLSALTGNKMDLRAALAEHVDLSKMRKGDEYRLYGHSDAVNALFHKYLHADLECTRQLYLRLAEEYKQVRPELVRLLMDVNMPYLRCILDMQQGINVQYSSEVEQTLTANRDNALAEIHGIVWAIGDETIHPAKRVTYTRGPKSDGPFCKLTPFNPGSSQQVVKVLQGLYGWTPNKTTTKGAPCVSTEVLEKLDYPIVASLLDYSKASKLLTFCEALRDSPVVYPSYNQCSTRTTRLSCSGPNLQQIPSRDETGKQLRGMFTPRDGYSFVVGDQSGFQLRILAGYLSYYFEEHRLTECFNRNEDVHEFFAGIYGVPRKIAKNCLDYDYTKVLTPAGWKWLRDVQVGDTVMGYNPETHQQEWTEVLDTVDAGYQECSVFGVGARTVHSTPNHDWVTVKESNNKRSTVYNGKVVQQEIHESTLTGKKVLHTAKYTGGTYTEIPDGKYEVDWVKWVLSASPEQRESFIQGFFLADGCYHNGTKSITQNEGNILDAIQLCWHLMGGASSLTIHSKPYVGKNSTHTCYSLRLIRRQHTTFLSMKQGTSYISRVGCLVTASGNFVVRDTQSKFITITGNCTFGYIFGAGVPKMTVTANRRNPNPITEDMIRGALDSLVARMPALPALRELFIERAVEGGGVIHDWLGTQYVIPELTSRNRTIRAAGERRVFNYMVQGLEASLFRKLQVRVRPIVRGFGARQVLVVHDELVYEVKTELAGPLASVLSTLMSPSLGDFTPALDKSDLHGLQLSCEFHTGCNWLSAKGD